MKVIQSVISLFGWGRGVELQGHFWWERIFGTRAEASRRVLDSTVTNREI
jgi:hypothetical protein